MSRSQRSRTPGRSRRSPRRGPGSPGASIAAGQVGRDVELGRDVVQGEVRRVARPLDVVAAALRLRINKATQHRDGDSSSTPLLAAPCTAARSAARRLKPVAPNASRSARNGIAGSPTMTSGLAPTTGQRGRKPALPLVREQGCAPCRSPASARPSRAAARECGTHPRGSSGCTPTSPCARCTRPSSPG